MKLRHILVFVVLMLAFIPIHAQDNEKPEKKTIAVYLGVYLENSERPDWENEFEEALFEFNQIEELELVTTPFYREADIVVSIYTRDEFNRYSGCPTPRARIACAGRIVVRNGDACPNIYGYVSISHDTNNKRGAILHELAHAIGVGSAFNENESIYDARGHSSDTNDVMFHSYSENVEFSENDITEVRLALRDWC